MKILPLIALATLAYATAAPAQNSAQPQRLPGLDDFSLPATRPTPRPPPSPEPTTNPRPVDSATPERVAPPRAGPTVRATATPRPTPSPQVAPTHAASETPVAQPIRGPVAPVLPTPMPTATQSALAPLPDARPTVAITVATSAPAPRSSWIWPAGAALALVAMLGAGLWWWRRRSLRDAPESRRSTEHEVFVLDPAEHAVEPAPAEAAPAVPAPPVAPPMVAAAPAPRAMLDLAFTPKRAGTNLLSAAVEYLVTVRNTGDVPATDIRLDIRLLSAGRRQDAVIAALFAGAIAQPITAPFDLAPATMAELGGLAMHPKDTLEVIAAGDRTLFVPVLAINLRYAWDGGEGQTARSYVVGIDRGADAKLAPFRLDGGARMLDAISALDYTVSAMR